MQTFLPFRSFSLSAVTLDDRRLNKQITEAKQIALAIRGETDAWASHPAVAMWRNNLGALIDYGLACYEEWQRRYDAGERGGKRDHKAGDWFLSLPAMDSTRPVWLGYPPLHEQYRALLLAKSDYYRSYGWGIAPDGDTKEPFRIALGLMGLELKSDGR